MEGNGPHEKRIPFFSSKRRLRGNPESADHNRRSHLLAEFLERNLAQMQEETTATQESSERNINENHEVLTTLPEDLLFKIFILVPAESLYRLQFVCKKWFGLINSTVFIKSHTRQSDETVLVCRKLTFPHLLTTIEGKPRSFFHFMNLDGGDNINHFLEYSSSVINFFDVRASCDGLILAIIMGQDENKGLIIINPITRKHSELPLGITTIIGTPDDESFGIAFCKEAKTYKVVHLFRYVSKYGCEILNISTRKWTIVVEYDELFGDIIRQIPVSIDGSLYWMPKKNGCDCFVSMNVQYEKFISRKLPIICNANDRLVEIGGALGLIIHDTNDNDHLMQVWVFSTNENNWIKTHSINIMNSSFRGFPLPICSSRNGKEIVFSSPGHRLNVYCFDKEEMKQVYSRNDVLVWNQRIENAYVPHRNTLVSWDQDKSS